MKEVTREEFKKLFFEHATPGSGWTHESWKQIDQGPDADTKYLYKPPATPLHDRLYISSGDAECRMFFMTDESDEAFFDHPGRD